MSQGTDTTFGDGAEHEDLDAPTEEHGFGPVTAPPPPRTPTGGFPAPRPPLPAHPWTGGRQQPTPTGSWPQQPTPTGSWPQQTHTGSWQSAYYGEEAEAPREGNAAAVTSCVLAILGLILSLRPLVFGSNAMAPDTYVALAISVLALVLGVVGARVPHRRPAAVVGVALSLVALLLVAVIPTL